MHDRSVEEKSQDLDGFKRFAIDICFGVKTSVQDVLDRLDKLSRWDIKGIEDEISSLHSLSKNDPKRLKNLRATFRRFIDLLQRPDVNLEQVQDELKRWAKVTKETIASRSPTSCEITLQHFWKAKGMNIEQVFEMDSILAQKCCVS
jgi:hypothetical protein